MDIPRTTLCYISRGEEWLFIHKSRENDHNKDKYLGIGGHIEPGETTDECMVREIFEETGIVASKDLSDLKFMGQVMFSSDKYGKEEMNVYSADYIGDINTINKDCNEGNLIWINKKDAYNLPIWEGDKLIFDMLIAGKAFNMSLSYVGDKLVDYDIKKV